MTPLGPASASAPRWGPARAPVPGSAPASALPRPLRVPRRAPPTLPALRPPQAAKTIAFSIPNLTPIPPSTTPVDARVTDLRRVHHFHTVPSPPRFLPWNDKSWTGDHYAVSRYASAFSLQFDHLARVIGILPAHFFLGSAAGVLFWYGTRQSIHSIILGTRNLARLRTERTMIEAALPEEGEAPPYLENLAHRNSLQRLQTLYYMAMDFSAGVGTTLIGAGTLLRVPLIGAINPKIFLPLALHISTAGFFPLVAPTAIAMVDRTVRTIRAVVRAYAMERHVAGLEGVDPELGEQVAELYRLRQVELARFFMIDLLARALLLAGAATSVFAGPGGLIMLIPSTVTVLTMECLSRRIVNVDDALPLEERFDLQTDDDFFAAIAAQHLDLETLRSLREQRRDTYPHGWGTVWRPLFRLYRYMRGHHEANPELSKDVLGAFAYRSTEISAWPKPTPHELVDLIDQTRMHLRFATSILSDRGLRATFAERGFTRDGKKWTLDADAMADTMVEIQAQPEADQAPVDTVYEKAEEVLLNYGLTEAYRRQRALLDHYGRFVQTAERLATTRNDS